MISIYKNLMDVNHPRDDKLMIFDKLSACKSDLIYVKYFKDLHVFYINNLKALALLRCADAKVAAIRYKNKYHKWPQQIEELIPEFVSNDDIIDPFNGQPIKLTNGNFDVVLFSSGINDKLNKIENRKILKFYSIGSNFNNEAKTKIKLSNQQRDITFTLLNNID